MSRSLGAVPAWGGERGRGGTYSRSQQPEVPLVGGKPFHLGFGAPLSLAWPGPACRQCLTCPTCMGVWMGQNVWIALPGWLVCSMDHHSISPHRGLLRSKTGGVDSCTHSSLLILLLPELLELLLLHKGLAYPPHPLPPSSLFFFFFPTTHSLDQPNIQLSVQLKGLAFFNIHTHLITQRHPNNRQHEVLRCRHHCHPRLRRCSGHFDHP